MKTKHKTPKYAPGFRPIKNAWSVKDGEIVFSKAYLDELAKVDVDAMVRRIFGKDKPK